MLLLVGAGGFVGTVLRYLTGFAVNSYMPVAGLTTLIVNFVGSFFIGVVYGLSEGKIDQQTVAILTIGVLGGFTTYSAFSAETITFLKQGQVGIACGYVCVMTLTCLVATYLGMLVAKPVMN